MQVHVVSDVHGNAEALARAGDGADALVCLGDFVLFLDYHDVGRGIFGRLFGVEAEIELVALRSAQRYDEARAWSRSRWASLDNASEVIESEISRQYAEMFGVLPDPTYLTYGNVDVPRLWPEHLPAHAKVLDGQTARIGDRTWGFVGGGLRTPMRTPHEISDEEFAAKVIEVGAVDVLACHIPPDVPGLLYDVEARRFERGSSAVLDAIRATQPALVLFGHVHQPLVQRTRIGRTECVNVGHFASTGTPYVVSY